MMGWHFTDETERLRFGDKRKIKVGITHEVECDPILCNQGLHASKTVLDALNYAPGHILYRVKLSGKIVHGDDKSAATKRTYLARLDAEKVLRQFARECALSVIHLWDCPSIVREYLETGEEELQDAARAAALDAQDAAQDAARAAAWAAALDAQDAAQDAARAAAWAAALDAQDAARDAARAAAWAAALGAQKKNLENLIKAAIK